MTLTFTEGHNCISKLTDALTCTLIVISRKIFKALAFKLGMNGRVMHGIYIQGHFDYLDLDARSQWLGRGNNSSWNYLDN